MTNPYLEGIVPGETLNDFSKNGQTNVTKFLDFLGNAEGANYNTIVGGGTFSDYSKHPGVIGTTTSEGPSTAAGKYQITHSTYKTYANKLGITDFSPSSQDKIALELIKDKGALPDVEKGDYDTAINKLGGVWASLPSSPYSQPKRSKDWVKANLKSSQDNPYLVGISTSESESNPYLQGIDSSTKEPAKHTSNGDTWIPSWKQVKEEGFAGRILSSAFERADLGDQAIKNVKAAGGYKTKEEYNSKVRQEYERLSSEYSAKKKAEETAQGPEPTLGESLKAFGTEAVTHPLKTIKSFSRAMLEDPELLALTGGVGTAAATGSKIAKAAKTAAQVGKIAATGAGLEATADIAKTGEINTQKVINTAGTFAVLGSTLHAATALAKSGVGKLGKRFDYDTLVDKVEADLKAKGIDLNEPMPEEPRVESPLTPQERINLATEGAEIKPTTPGERIALEAQKEPSPQMELPLEPEKPNLEPEEGSLVSDLFKDINAKSPDEAVLKTANEIKANSRMASVWRRTIETLVKDPVTRERITMAMEKEKEHDKILTDKEMADTIEGLSKSSERLKSKVFKTEEEAQANAERIKRIDYVVEKLKSLPSEEYAIPIMESIQKVYSDIGKAARKQGIMERVVTNYVNHALNFAESKLTEPQRKSLTELIFRENNEKFTRDFTLERQFRFIRDLEKAIIESGEKLGIDTTGVKVEKDIAKLAEMYMKSMSTAILEQRLLNHLETIKVPGIDGELIPLVTKNSEIAFKNGYEQFKGKDVGRSKGYAVHPDIVPVLKFLWDYRDPNVVLKAMSGIAALGKILNTSASLFHLKSLGEVRLLNEPVTTLTDAFSGFSGTKLALNDIKRSMGTGVLSPDWLLKRGFEFDIKEIDRSKLVEMGKAVDKAINDTLAVDPKLLERTLSPINSVLLEPANKLTWDYGHAAGKYFVAVNTMAKMKVRNPNMSWDAIAKEVIPYINDQFGGINWLEIAQTANGRYAKAFAYWLFSKQGSPLMQTILFAPDWTVSTFRAYYKALPDQMLKRIFKPGTWEFKEAVKGIKNPKTHQDLARLYVLKNALMWVTLLEGINLMTSGHHIWENKDPTRIDLGDGTTMQLAKHSMEAIHWLRDPMKTAGNKLSPVIKAPYILATGKAYPAMDAPMVAGRDFPSRVGAAASQFLPFQLNEIIKAPPGEKAKRAVASMLGAPIYGTTSKQFTSSEVQQERKLHRKETMRENKLKKLEGK